MLTQCTDIRFPNKNLKLAFIPTITYTYHTYLNMNFLCTGNAI